VSPLHRVNGDRPCHRPLRRANPGCLVQITGRREVFRYSSDQEEDRELRHVVVQDFKVLLRSRMYPVVQHW
jgi:hypothetical protein